MKKAMIVIDMQNDFITGALGTKEAQGIVKNAADAVRGCFAYRNCLLQSLQYLQQAPDR